MQEGQLSTRIAFLGKYDVSFMCGAGEWRESMHSGQYGHSSHLPSVDLRSVGYQVLSNKGWLDTEEWDFDDYNSILMSYTGRQLTVESDRLNAISGCLNLIAQKKNMRFFSGLPSKDFHYALLWDGEYDRPRLGFPTWSWAGWHALQQSNIMLIPSKGVAQELLHSEKGSFKYDGFRDGEVELGGIINRGGMESPHLWNRSLQKLASIHLCELTSILTITSELAHFTIDLAADTSELPVSRYKTETQRVLPELDSTVGPLPDWNSELDYKTPFARFRLRDSDNNITENHYPYWMNHPPFIKLCFPMTLRGSTLSWLLNDGIDLIKIIEVKLIEGAPELKPFYHVLCLGIDRSGCTEGRGKRMGWFCIPKEVWEKAKPKNGSIQLSW